VRNRDEQFEFDRGDPWHTQDTFSVLRGERHDKIDRRGYWSYLSVAELTKRGAKVSGVADHKHGKRANFSGRGGGYLRTGTAPVVTGRIAHLRLQPATRGVGGAWGAQMECPGNSPQRDHMD